MRVALILVSLMVLWEWTVVLGYQMTNHFLKYKDAIKCLPLVQYDSGFLPIFTGKPVNGANGWMDDLRFYFLVNSISVISG